MAELQGDVYAAVSIVWAAALLALIARVFARRLTKITWWYDDYFCILAFVFACGYNAILIYCNEPWTAHWWMGRTMPDSLSEEYRKDILFHARLLQFCVSLNYAFSIAFSKLSILFFYWRIFKHSAIRIPIQIMVAITISWIILRTFMAMFRCVPIAAYWDKTIENSRCDINDSQFFFGTCLTHFVMDIVILILPVIEVFKLRLRIGQKFAITALFIVGFVVCLASMFVIFESIRYDVHTTQVPRDMTLNDTWGAVEINVAIVSGCFPLLRPIFRFILPATFLNSYGSSHPTGISGVSRNTNAMRLTALIRTHREKEIDESSSTHQLADPEQGTPNPAEYEVIEGKDGVQTVVFSPRDDRLPREDGKNGIYVRNDVKVEVEELQHTYAMKR
ncbi:hypothetical protein FZEAL_8295 [Fusarium zealandicum]|uniref:Rhodopsin domain-containing protein n=1 Tax=Fusarium zealandicum TaxID=1053134 RepID=A0A8H4UE55_9HYPO|nr:hypothetical protein FZEAL_8295 [Fusarium zealandicum]